MASLQKFFNDLGAAVAVDFLVGVTITKDVIAGELIYVILLDFTFLAGGSGCEIFIQYGAVISEWIGVRQRCDFLFIFADAPCLNVFVFIDKGT